MYMPVGLRKCIMSSGVARGGGDIGARPPSEVENFQFCIVLYMYLSYFQYDFLAVISGLPPPGLCSWTPLGDFHPPDLLTVPLNIVLAPPLIVSVH